MEHERSRSKNRASSTKSASSKSSQGIDPSMRGNSWAMQMLGSQAAGSLFGDNTRQLAEAEHLTISEQGSYNTAESLPGLVEQQLIEGLRSEGWEVANATEALEMIDSDGVTVKQITITGTGDCYTHLEFYMGDTEVGYIYGAGTMEQVAVVSDQDIHASEDLEPNRLASPGSELDPADRALFNHRRF